MTDGGDDEAVSTTESLEAKPPTPEETAIEAPWRLVISPNAFAV